MWLLFTGSGSCRFSYSDPSIIVSYTKNNTADWVQLERIRFVIISGSFVSPDVSGFLVPHLPSFCHWFYSSWSKVLWLLMTLNCMPAHITLCPIWRSIVKVSFSTQNFPRLVVAVTNRFWWKHIWGNNV